jgi:hypothetical protein
VAQLSASKALKLGIVRSSESLGSNKVGELGFSGEVELHSDERVSSWSSHVQGNKVLT